MVYSGLSRFGWQEADGKWHLGGFSFSLEECLVQIVWKKVAHAIRESVRRWHYGELMRLTRHEFAGQAIPPYDPWRIEVVRKWVRKDSLAMMIATGSLSSGAVRKRSRPNLDFPCPKCGEHNVYWDHYWHCWAECPPPEDVMLRRFLWPRSKEDLPFRDSFHRYAGLMIDCHQQATWGSQMENNQ